MAEWALVKDDVIENIIVVDDGDSFATDHAASDETPFDRAVDVSTLAVPPGVGWVFKKGIGYVPPVTLASDVETVKGNGKDAATITYTDNTAAPPAEVEADVNGTAVTLPVAGGVATLTVTSTYPGDLVTVRAGNQTIWIGVE